MGKKKNKVGRPAGSAPYKFDEYKRIRESGGSIADVAKFYGRDDKSVRQWAAKNVIEVKALVVLPKSDPPEPQKEITKKNGFI